MRLPLRQGVQPDTASGVQAIPPVRDTSYVKPDNMFTGAIPSSWETLKRLKALALDDNFLQEELDTVWTLPNLEFLFAENNEFDGMLPNDIIETNRPLQQLDLSGNNLFGTLPALIFRLTELEVLDLHGNQFSMYLFDR